MDTIAALPTLSIREELTVPFVPADGYADTMRGLVEPWLAERRAETELPVKDGTLHCEDYVLPGAARAVVLLHGYTESAEKLRELAWYFLHSGFSVFSYDHRGHGRSLRLVEDESVTHVARFDDYVRDLDVFVRDHVWPLAPEAELTLFCHSMGGAVGAHYLIEHPEVFARAVLSSPMIAPSAGAYPLWLGGLMAGTMTALGKGRERAFIGQPFDAARETFETSCTSCPERFRYYADKRAATRTLQNCSPTYRWTLEAVTQRHDLLRPRRAARIAVPVLLCQATLDDVVLLPPQDRFIKLVPQGTLKRYEAKHEIYNSPDEVMRPYVRDVIGFLLG